MRSLSDTRGRSSTDGASGVTRRRCGIPVSMRADRDVRYHLNAPIV
jgi:hypothetical protein